MRRRRQSNDLLPPPDDRPMPEIESNLNRCPTNSAPSIGRRCFGGGAPAGRTSISPPALPADGPTDGPSANLSPSRYHARQEIARERETDRCADLDVSEMTSLCMSSRAQLDQLIARLYLFGMFDEQWGHFRKMRLFPRVIAVWEKRTAVDGALYSWQVGSRVKLLRFRHAENEWRR